MMNTVNPRKRPAKNTGRGPHRSVVDFDNEDSLRKALMADDERDDNGRISKESESPDWVLDNYDPEITEVQTMSSEVLRLQVLKSYMILDADREEAFERITALASRIFDVPIALVSLVDLGRQWFLSNRGLGNVRETSRKYAFCAHAIQSRNNMLIVPDATADFRFEDNPLVTGHPNIRFYAGAPMISPEGYRLGTLCIIDTIPRPHGLNAEEQETLRDLADMTVKVMEDRKQMEKQTVDPAELIAHIAHDLLTPLTGIQLSLRMLKDDEEIINTLGELHLELLNTAVSCSDLMTRICETAVQGLRKEDGNSASSTPNEVQPCSTTSTRSSMSTTCVTKISDLIRSLHMIIDPMDKSVPCVITLADNVPPCVVGDDLKLFRSSLNLLTNALSSTLTGIVRFTIRPDDDFDQLLFECEDTGSDIPVDDYPFLFQPRRSDDGSVRLGLSSVASLIGSLGGEYGFRPRSVGPDGRVLVDATGRSLSGSIFWFSIRLLVPESSNNISQSHILPQVGNACSALVNSQPPLASDRTATANSSTLEKAATTICRGNRCEDMIAKLAGVKTISHGPSYAVNLDIAKSSVDGALASGSLNQTFAENLDFNVRKRKALVIDDSLVIRKSLSYALAKLGYDVAVAVDGMEGLKELKNVLFDLVLCDLLMPVMDGLDCVKQYRDWENQHRPWFKQLIIGISAHANMNDNDQAILAGMDGFKSKPISFDQLKELQNCDAAVERSRTLDQIDYCSSSTKPTNCGGTVQPVTLGESYSMAATHDVSLNDSHGQSSDRVCLIASASLLCYTSQLAPLLEANGFKIMFANNGIEARGLLQLRNWDVVLIDDDLPKLSGAACVKTFRRWEQQNRVNGQKNIFFVCDGNIPSPSDKTSLVQPPDGFNGVLRKPVPWDDLQYLIGENRGNDRFNIVVRC